MTCPRKRSRSAKRVAFGSQSDRRHVSSTTPAPATVSILHIAAPLSPRDTQQVSYLRLAPSQKSGRSPRIFAEEGEPRSVRPSASRMVAPDPSLSRGLHATLSEAIGRFLGVNVGTTLQRKLRASIVPFAIAIVCTIICLNSTNSIARQEVNGHLRRGGLSDGPGCLVVVLTIAMAAGTMSVVDVIVRDLKSLEALALSPISAVTRQAP